MTLRYFVGIKPSINRNTTPATFTGCPLAKGNTEWNHSAPLYLDTTLKHLYCVIWINKKEDLSQVILLLAIGLDKHSIEEILCQPNTN